MTPACVRGMLLALAVSTISGKVMPVFHTSNSIASAGVDTSSMSDNEKIATMLMIENFNVPPLCSMRNQYFCFSGITPRTPPLGLSVSFSLRGINLNDYEDNISNAARKGYLALTGSNSQMGARLVSRLKALRRKISNQRKCCWPAEKDRRHYAGLQRDCRPGQPRWTR